MVTAHSHSTQPQHTVTVTAHSHSTYQGRTATATAGAHSHSTQSQHTVTAHSHSTVTARTEAAQPAHVPALGQRGGDVQQLQVDNAANVDVVPKR